MIITVSDFNGLKGELVIVPGGISVIVSENESIITALIRTVCKIINISQKAPRAKQEAEAHSYVQNLSFDIGKLLIMDDKSSLILVSKEKQDFCVRMSPNFHIEPLAETLDFSPKPKIMFIVNPENNLHPRSQNRIVIQLISHLTTSRALICTNSPYILSKINEQTLRPPWKDKAKFYYIGEDNASLNISNNIDLAYNSLTRPLYHK